VASYQNIAICTLENREIIFVIYIKNEKSSYLAREREKQESAFCMRNVKMWK
jgi:hypothetical protein